MLKRPLMALLLAALAFHGADVAAQSADEERLRTLADIRQDLVALEYELRRLRRELATTGPSQVRVTGSTLDRIDAIEKELRRLTAETERLEQRITRIVEDGTRRIGDLEFQLTELAGGDISKLGPTPPLGGEEETPAIPQTGEGTDSSEPAPELAVGEEADFRAAQAALEAGQAEQAADLFARFLETYPASPFEAAALLGMGKALEQAGDTRGAARAYLDSYSTDAAGPASPEALYRLGAALGRLGKTPEACLTLEEVERQFPQAAEVEFARAEMAKLNCQ